MNIQDELKEARELRKQRGLLLTQPWAHIALAIGIDPLDVEGQGRDILKRLATAGVKVTPKTAES